MSTEKIQNQFLKLFSREFEKRDIVLNRIKWQIDMEVEKSLKTQHTPH